MKKKIIGISGTYGTGKTDYMLQITRELKRDNPGKSIGCLTGNCAYAPRSICGVNSNASLQDQYWIFTTQMANEMMSLEKFDIVVTDRTPMDAVAYTVLYGFTASAKAMLNMALAYIPLYYSEIYFRRIDDYDHLYNDGHSLTDQKFRKAIEDKLLYLYKVQQIVLNFDNYKRIRE